MFAIFPLLFCFVAVRKDELQAAIELSLQESHNAQEEERQFHRYTRIDSAND